MAEGRNSGQPSSLDEHKLNPEVEGWSPRSVDLPHVGTEHENIVRSSLSSQIASGVTKSELCLSQILRGFSHDFTDLH